MQSTTTLRFAGFGGQGIVKSGEIFGVAAMTDGKKALQNQSYGSSARGGLCTTDVCISEGEIHEIEPEVFDVLVLLSQDSCNAFLSMLRPGGTLIYEEDLVKLPGGSSLIGHAIPATRIATQDLGRRIVTNMVLLGFCGAVTRLISKAALEGTIEKNVPRGTETLNLRAFNEGWNRGSNTRVRSEIP
jgi:2-oxoglutarate ferredoxin oxidoreductase subunit gamma